MWPKIAVLVALTVPLQNSSQAQTSYRPGLAPVPLFQRLQQQDQSQAKVLFVRPSPQGSQAQAPGQLGSVPQFQPRQGMMYAQGFRIEKMLAQQNSNMCFAIRSYIFKRDDGKAPVLVKTMTCTPNAVFLQKAGPLPEPHLVPAD